MALWPLPLMARVSLFRVWKAYWMPALISSITCGSRTLASAAIAPLAPAELFQPILGVRKRRGGKESWAGAAHLQHFRVHVSQDLAPSRSLDAAGHVAGPRPEEQPLGHGQGPEQLLRRGNTEQPGGHGTACCLSPGAEPREEEQWRLPEQLPAWHILCQ